ncbi:PorP/SprF family type IX secretion system membrane protein [Patescibacteria group bacterium]|nr:PorP/SprF family type IX secretion system membrane protein [Patescibacteria group bacterium]MBU1758909.1 PorP/SprF family type IX secretion system membrane protein [Patescibacteria group bacterium]
MKKNMIIAVVLIMINLSAVAQLQVGQGINSWFHKTPQVHNMGLIYMSSVPMVSLTGSSCMDGFGNHPTQGTILASGFLTDGVGIGCKIDREKAGLSGHLDAQVAFVYRIFLSKEKGDKLSFFLGGHFTQDQFATNDVVVLDPNDPGLQNVSQFQPNGNASAGFSFLRENKYYAGISSYQLLENKNAFLNSEWENVHQRTYYFVGGYTYELNEKFGLELSGASVFANAKAFVWDIGLDLKFNKMCWLGVGYRSIGAMKFDIGVTAQSWSFGYLCVYGSWVDVKAYTYKSINNSIFIRKVFNEGRGNK